MCAAMFLGVLQFTRQPRHELILVPSETCGKLPDGVPYHVWAAPARPGDRCLCPRMAVYDPSHPAARELAASE